MQTSTNITPFYPPTVKPSARALPLLPFLARFVSNPLRSLPRAVYEQRIVTYGRRPLVAWVTDPDLTETVLLKQAAIFPKTRLDKRVLKPVVGDGLLTSDGEKWKWQRKLASPLFRHQEVLAYVPHMAAAANEQVARWRDLGPGNVADILLDMTETTFTVIARTVLAGIDEASGKDIQRAGHGYLDPIMWEVAAALLRAPEGMWHPGRNKMRKAAVQGRAEFYKLLEKRRALGPGGDDLIGRMMAARDPETGQAMSDEELVDNLATFLIAGHETTAKALVWTIYLLARAPDWQEKIREEIASVTGGGRSISAEDVARLSLTQRVLKESMRLYPPVPVMTRVNIEPFELGGVQLAGPTLIVVPVYAIHRHRKLWSDPDRFDPDRFLESREGAYRRTQFMPFGFGQRVCIGASFAMTEATVLLATFVSRARFSWDGRHVPEPVSRVTLRPKGGMPLIVNVIA